VRHKVVVGEGDQWVLGGGLAISALAGATLLDVSVGLLVPHAARAALHLLTSWLGWAAVMAYVPLAVTEAIRPRLRFDMRRWSTVFPIGMAAQVSLQISRVFHEDMLWDLGQALSWVALAVWSIVAVGSLRRARNIAAGPGRQE
jgi:tellurite resistance protein TehA-like permease